MTVLPRMSGQGQECWTVYTPALSPLLLTVPHPITNTNDFIDLEQWKHAQSCRTAILLSMIHPGEGRHCGTHTPAVALSQDHRPRRLVVPSHYKGSFSYPLLCTIHLMLGVQLRLKHIHTQVVQYHFKCCYNTNTWWLL